MAKKMTKKEFFEVLDNAHCVGMDDFEGILNCLVRFLYAEANDDEQRAKNAKDEETKALYTRCSSYRNQEAHDIFEALDKRGYYDSVRR